MKAYKFKSADQLSHALDIIHNKRLFCSDWKNLNDPLEGQFFYTHGIPSRSMSVLVQPSDIDDFAELIANAKGNKRICSLSLTAESILLWAHYASNYTGLVLEVDIPKSDVKFVSYTGPKTIELNKDDEADDLATRILTTKFKDWRYEKEVRIIAESKWYNMDKDVTRVICGPRMHYAIFQTLELICRNKNIPISRMYIDIEGIDLTGERNPVNQLVYAFQGKL